MEDLNNLKDLMKQLKKKLNYIIRNLNETYLRENLKVDLEICRTDFNKIIKLYFNLGANKNIIFKTCFDKLELDLMFATNILKPCSFLLPDFMEQSTL